MVFCEPVPRSMVTSSPWAAKAPMALAVMKGACGPWTCQSSANFTLVCACASAHHAPRPRRTRQAITRARVVSMGLLLGGLRADIFRPQGGVGLNELCHQLLAPSVLEHVDRHPAASKQILLAAERSVLTHHHARDAVQENRAAAHRARRERGVDGAVAIDAGGLATGVLERVHLAVENDAASLDPPIVATAEDPPVVHQHRADGDAALGRPALGLLDRSSQKCVHCSARMA